MTKEYEINKQRKAYANFVQDLKNDGLWDAMSEIKLPGPNGPLNKTDLEQIWREETIEKMSYSIGAAQDLSKLIEPKQQISTLDSLVHLSLDLYQVDEHPQVYMRNLGIKYQHATPQSISDSWWFWNCSNVPDPLPIGLRILEITPHQAIGYGLSKKDAERLENKMF